MHLIKQNKTSGFHEWRPSELRHYTDFAAKYNGHFEKNLRGHRSGSHSLLVVGIFHPAYLMEGSSCLHSALQSENPGVSYNSSVHSEAWWGAAQRFHTTAPVGLLPWTSLPRRCESGLKKWGYPSGSLTQRFSNSHWFKMLFFLIWIVWVSVQPLVLHPSLLNSRPSRSSGPHPTVGHTPPSALPTPVVWRIPASSAGVRPAGEPVSISVRCSVHCSGLPPRVSHRAQTTAENGT